MKLLQSVLHEINPRNDGEGIREGLPSLLDAEDFNDFLRRAGSKFYAMVKPIARGAVIGGVIGAVGIFDKENKGSYLLYGLTAGILIDSAQYGVQALRCLRNEKIGKISG